MWLLAAGGCANHATGVKLAAETQTQLAQPAKAELDGKIAAQVADYQQRIAKLDWSTAAAGKCRPGVEKNLLLLGRLYNAPYSKYSKEHFTRQECFDAIIKDMQFYLDNGLEAHKDPFATFVGWRMRCCWLEGPDFVALYQVFIPKGYDATKNWPVMISYQNSPKKGMDYFLISGIQKGYPSSLVTVQAKTRSAVLDVASEYNIDPLRFYATGFSYGGHTCEVVAWRYPDWFAAIVPLCSDLRDEKTPLVAYLWNVPTLLLHGDNDAFLAEGKRVYEIMQAAGCPVSWQLYPGGHTAEPIYQGDLKVVTDFCDQHRMDPYPKRVKHVVEHKRYSRAFWVDCKLVRDGELSATYDVRVEKDNVIRIEADENVAELTLDLVPALVDWSKPVTVLYGEKKLYAGMPKPGLTVKLRDGEPYNAESSPLLWRDWELIGDAAAARGLYTDSRPFCGTSRLFPWWQR